MIIRRLMVLTAPLCVTLAIFGPDIARAVFARGAFTEAAVWMTSEALRGISLGLWAATAGWVMIRLLNRAGRNRTAAAILVAAYVSNLMFNFVAFHIPVTTHQTLVLGSGESVRGLMLLGATATCLGLVRSTLASIAWARIPAVGMAVAGFAISMEVANVWLRLGLTGAACGLCLLATGAALMPEPARALLHLGRRTSVGPLALLIRVLRRA